MFAQMLEKEAQGFLERVDKWLTDHETHPDENPTGSQAVRLASASTRSRTDFSTEGMSMKLPTKHGLTRALPPLVTVGLVTLAVLAAASSSAGIQGSGFRSLSAIAQSPKPATVTTTSSLWAEFGIPPREPYLKLTVCELTDTIHAGTCVGSSQTVNFKYGSRGGIPNSAHNDDVVVTLPVSVTVPIADRLLNPEP